MPCQDQCGGDRQVSIEDLAAGDKDHGLAFAEHHLLLTRIGGAMEDMDGHGVREVLLVRSRAGPQGVQLARGQACFLQQLATSGLFRCLARLNAAAR